mmetsp:Transcript_27929/g.59799  ORF Transcript_27929/g.59799 Transcript_27929/m.59799 type:complete len:281 (-) Transcript_27929:830-1672(-)
MRIRKNNKQKYIQWCKNDDTKCYSFSWNRSIVSRQRCLPAVVGVASGNTRAARVRAALLSLLFPLFLVRPRRCLGRLLLVLLPGELLLLFLRLQPLGLPRPGDGGRDLEPPRPRGQLSNDRGQLGHQRPLRVQVALQHGGIDPDPAGVVPEGRRVAAVSLVGLRDVPDAHRCEGLADVLDRGGVDGLLGTDPPALFYRLGRVEVAGVDHKEVGGVHRKTFLWQQKRREKARERGRDLFCVSDNEIETKIQIPSEVAKRNESRRLEMKTELMFCDPAGCKK